MNSLDRKKQTHLRCERQRREAINNGYNKLKELLPVSSSFTGCKTTNAAILFRAAKYIQSLNELIVQNDKEFVKLKTQFSALEIILKQYENFSVNVQPLSTLQILMLKNFLDCCFQSFTIHVDISNYQLFTKSLLLFIEKLDFQVPAEALLSLIFKE